MAFNYWPVVTEHTGGGDFIGKRQGDAYLGVSSGSTRLATRRNVCFGASLP